MEKEFIPYKQALALKELGFDESCWCYFMGDVFNSSMFPKDYEYLNTLNQEYITYTLAPLYQQAFKFVLGIIENDSKLERKFLKRHFLDFTSEGFQMDDNEKFTTYESDELTLRNIINFIIKNK
jgi:hypothetical protein